MLTEEQKEKRKSRLGGSDIPAVLGVSPYTTRRELMLQKLGMAPDTVENRAMLRGSLLEPVVAKLLKDEIGLKFSKPKRTMEHPEHPWLVAHFDGITAKNELVEIKTQNLSRYLKTKREGLPVEISSQVQAYLSWPKLKKAYVIVFSAEIFEYFVVEQEADPEFQEIIFREGAQFISDLYTGNIPPEEAGPIIDLPVVQSGEVLHLSSPEFLRSVEDLREAEELVKEATEIKEAAKAEILRLMGNADVVEAEGVFRAYNREQSGRRSFQEKLFNASHPGIDLSPFYKVGANFRTFKAYFLTNKGGNNQ